MSLRFRLYKEDGSYKKYDDTNRQENIPESEGFVKAQAQNDDHVYVVYDVADLYQSAVCTWDPKVDGVLVGGTLVETKFVIQSFHGYENNGIVLFPARNYGGIGKQYSKSGLVTEDDFPEGQKGVSSFIVLSGKWSLKDKDGIILSLPDGHGGKATEFGPGSMLRNIGDGNDVIRAVERS